MKAKSILTLLLTAGLLAASYLYAQTDIVWEKSYNLRSGGYADRIFYEPEDGYLLVSAVISQYDGDEGYGDQAFPVVIRLGVEGEPIWIHEGPATKVADAPVITRCNWGGYLAIGAVKPDEEQTPWSLRAVNVDIETGEVAWECSYPTDELTSVRVGSVWNGEDGRMLVFGWTHPAQYWVEPTHDQVFVMEIDSETGELFETTYLEGTERVSLSYVQRTIDGFLLVGRSGEPEPRYGSKAFAMRIDQNNQVLWTTEFEGEGEDKVTSLAFHPGGYYLLCSNYDSNLEMEQTYIINMNPDGEVIWRENIGGDWQTSGSSISLSNDGNIWVGGRCIPWGDDGPDHAWLASVNSQGQLLWQQNISGDDYGSVNEVNRTRDNDLILALTGPKVMWVAPGANGVHQNERAAPPKDIQILSLAPNPFNAVTALKFTRPEAGKVSVVLTDMSGREFYRQSVEGLTPGEHLMTLDGSGMTAGSYIVTVRQGEKSASSRIVLMK